MPNHVTNILTLQGPLKRVKEVFKAISPSPTEEELKGGLRSTEPVFKPASPANLAKRKSETYEIDFERIVPMPTKIFRGDVGQAEREKHGADNWYDWCCSNWGTKWNAYEQEKLDDYSMQFNTAWAMPEPVMRALSEKFPDVEVQIKWADEDMGQNCGEIHYRGGHETFTDTPEGGSKEAYELAFELKGYGKEYYRYDEEKGTYVPKEEESRCNIGQMTADLKKIFEDIPLDKDEDTVRRGSFKQTLKNTPVDPDKLEEQGVMPYANDENMIGMTARSSVALRHRPTVLSKDQPDPKKDEVENESRD